jgi:hypothetical protein
MNGIADAFNGHIDEFRLAHVQRSDGWIATTWNNMSDPAAFAVAGTEEQEGGRAATACRRRCGRLPDGVRANTRSGDPRHGRLLARRSVGLPAPMERAAYALWERTTHTAPLDRHRRGHLLDGIARRCPSILTQLPLASAGT